MNFPFYIARKYFFSKKSHSAINIISMVSVCGIAIATLALVCTLSVFNGFTKVVTDTFSAFDPELQIVPVKGKVFDGSSAIMNKVKSLPSIQMVSESLEENALLKFGHRQQPVLLKGVSPEFTYLTDMKKLMLDGKFELTTGDVENAVPGAGLAMSLGVSKGFLDPIEIYMPKRNAEVNMLNPSAAFTRADVYVSGVFALNQAEYDNQMLIVSIGLMRKLLDYKTEVSSIDIKVNPGVSVQSVRKQIQQMLGNQYQVNDRFAQQRDLYRMVNVEKWVTFLILAIILVIAAFNIVGSLSMLIIDKTADIMILKNLGADNKLITKIFIIEGWIISFMGAIIGLIIGLVICLLQQHLGLLKLGSSGDSFIMDAYPVQVQVFDIIFIFIIVNILGFLAVLYPVNTLRKKLNALNRL